MRTLPPRSRENRARGPGARTYVGWGPGSPRRERSDHVRVRTAILGLLALVALYCLVAVWLMRKEAGLAPVPGRPGRTDAEAGETRPVLVAAPHVSAPRTEAQPVVRAEPEAEKVCLREIDPSQRLALTVVDVATGEPVPGVRIGWTASRGRIEPVLVLANPVSDASGRIELPRADVSRLLALAPGWSIASRPEADVLADGRLFVSRMLDVHVVVSVVPGSSLPLDMDSVSVAVGPRPFEGTAADGTSAVYSGQWHESRGTGKTVWGELDAEGRTTVRVPWSRGWLVRARAPGWSAATVVLAEPALGESSADVRIALSPVPQLRVRVLGPEGDGLFRASVAQFVKRVFPSPEDAAREVWGNRTAGLGTNVRNREDGTAIATLRMPQLTEADGRVVLDLPLESEITLVTQADDLLADVRRFPAGSDDVELEIRLRAPSRPEARVAITLGGVPVRGPRLVLLDVTDPDVQIPHVLIVRNGSVLAERFVLGRPYAFSDGGQLRYLRWDGRAGVELIDLPQDPKRIADAVR